MAIAVDQTKLRRIVETLLSGVKLESTEALTVVQIAQLAAGVKLDDDPPAQAILQAIAQQVCSLVGLKPGEIRPIPLLADYAARAACLEAVAKQLRTRGARELAYALAFLVSVADLELAPVETTALEAFQRALGLDHRRATDLVIFLSETVAADEAAPTAF